MKLFTEKVKKIALWIVLLDIVLIPVMLWWSYIDYSRNTPYDEKILTIIERIKQNQKIILEGMDIETIEATAYSWTGNPMANGKYPEEGYIANNDIPFGTRVYIFELDRTYTVGDRIGCCSSLDIYMNTKEKAQKFGRQIIHIKILD